MKVVVRQCPCGVASTISPAYPAMGRSDKREVSQLDGAPLPFRDRGLRGIAIVAWKAFA